MEHTAFQCPVMTQCEKTLKVILAGRGAGQGCQTRFLLAQETFRVWDVTNRPMVSGRMPR